MIRLLRVELRRLGARKVVWLTLLAAVAITLMTLSGIFLQARSIDAARAGADENYQSMVQESERAREQCLVEEANERRRTGDPTVDFGCQMITVPTPEEMYGEMPSLGEQYEQFLARLAFPFMFLALGMGSTAVAAEFAHRTMGSLLTFEPRRTRVFVAKVLAPAIASLPLVVTGLVLVLVGTPAVFRWWGLDGGVTTGEWTALGWTALRVLAITMLAGALGAAAAFVLKHSGLVLGLLVGYLVLVEGIFANMAGSLSRLTLTRNIAAWVEHGTQWSTWPANCAAFEDCQEVVHRLSFTHGVLVLTGLLAAVVLLGWAMFRRADLD